MNKLILVDFYKKYGRLPHTHLETSEFADDPLNLRSALLIAFKMDPVKALAYLKKRGKNIKLTSSWDQIDSNAHSQSFTVSKVMSADVLQEVYNYVEVAKKDGWSFEKFRDSMVNGGMIEKMTSAGWQGKSPSRLKVIYETNMNTTFMKGRYQSMSLLSSQGLADLWEYLPSHSHNPNPLHMKFYYKKYRFDDPIWEIIQPPSRIGCMCSARGVMNSEMNKKGWVPGDGMSELDQILNSDPKMLKEYESQQKSKLDLTKAWKPDTTKYTKSIKVQLDSILKK